ICASYLTSVPNVSLPPPTVGPSSLWDFESNNPSPFGLEKLHANRIAVAMQWLAVGHSSRGAKLSGARDERQLLALLPIAHADHAGAARTHVFRKSRFGAGRPPMTVEHYRYFHRDALFGAKKCKCRFQRHGRGRSSLETRRDAREILNTGSAIFHAIQIAIRGGKQFFWSVAVFRERGDAGAHGECRGFGLGGQPLANASDNARGNFAASLRQHQRKLVSTIARGGIDGARMAPQNFSEAHQCAAPGQVPELIIDAFEAVHIEQDDAEGALRAARAIQLGFQYAQQTPVIREPGELIAHGHGADLLKKARLIQERAGEHHDVADGLGDFGEEKGSIKELAGE